MIFRVFSYILLFAVASGLTPIDAAAVQIQGHTAETPSGLESLMNRLAEGDTSVIGEVEKMYDALPKEDSYRANIASLLVSRKVKNPRYWNYLVKVATPAIDTDMPDPTAVDATGKAVRQKLSEEFTQWCKKQHLDPNKAAKDAIYELPSRVWPLAASGDPRGFSLLMKGLQSRNGYVASVAALGLAHIGDSRAIAFIQGRCEMAPQFSAQTIGLALVYFNDPKAELGAKRCISDQQFLEAMREDAKKRGRRTAFFPW